MLSEALVDVATFALPENIDALRAHLDADRIEEALCYAGTASIRRRRLPAEQVIWLVIAMALYRNEPIENIVERLDLALPDKRGTLLAKSTIARSAAPQRPRARVPVHRHGGRVVGTKR